MQNAVITGASWSNPVSSGGAHHGNHRVDMRAQQHVITECQAVNTGNDPRDCFLYREGICKDKCRFLKFDEYCDYI